MVGQWNGSMVEIMSQGRNILSDNFRGLANYLVNHKPWDACAQNLLLGTVHLQD
jgi:hypothetical protein